MSTLPCLPSFLSLRSISHTSSLSPVTTSSFYANNHFFGPFQCLGFSSRHYYVISLNSYITILHVVILQLRVPKLRFSDFLEVTQQAKDWILTWVPWIQIWLSFYCITLSSSPPCYFLSFSQICITSLFSWKPFKMFTLGLPHYLPELACIVFCVNTHNRVIYPLFTHSFTPHASHWVKLGLNTIDIASAWKEIAVLIYKFWKLKSREFNEFSYTNFNFLNFWFVYLFVLFNILHFCPVFLPR